MGRQNKPWYRRSKKCWYVTVNGKMVRLDPDKDESVRLFHELKAKKPVLKNDQLLVVVMDELLTWTKKYRRLGTYRFYIEHFQQFTDWLKETRQVGIECSQLTPAIFESYLETISDGRHSGAVQSIKRVYNWGLKRGRISMNPIMALEKPVAGKRMNLVPDSEYKKMLKNTDEAFRDLLTFCWQTGCRPQEAWRVRIEHIDRKHQRLILPLDETKRKKGDRVIYCNQTAWRIVVARMQSDGFIFINTHGTQWNKDNVSNRIDAIVKTTGKRYALYDVRHTWITKRVKQGMDIYMIAKLAGTSPEMIRRHYDQSDQDAEFMTSLVRDLERQDQELSSKVLETGKKKSG